MEESKNYLHFGFFNKQAVSKNFGLWVDLDDKNTLILSFHFKENLDNFDAIRVIMGNEACDLDSAISSLVYAYFLYEIKDASISNHVVVPLLNIKSSDYKLKTEVKYLLDRMGIPANLLIFRDNPFLNLKDLCLKQKLLLTLVDHNTLPEQDNCLIPCVVEILDHHHKELSENDKEYNCDICIEYVGSCCTLIAEKIFNKQHACLMDPMIIEMIYATIILDTICLSSDAGRTTMKDMEVIERLQSHLPGLAGDRDKLYENLTKAKCDISCFSDIELLLKDVKIVANSNGAVKIAVSSFPVLAQVVLTTRGSSMLNSLNSFCKANCYNASLILGINLEKVNGENTNGDLGKIARDMAIYCAAQDIHLDLLSTLPYYLTEFNNNELGLVPISTAFTKFDDGNIGSSLFLFNQLNVKATRKHIIPMLQKYLIDEDESSFEKNMIPIPTFDGNSIEEDNEELEQNKNGVYDADTVFKIGDYFNLDDSRPFDSTQLNAKYTGVPRNDESKYSLRVLPENFDNLENVGVPLMKRSPDVTNFQNDNLINSYEEDFGNNNPKTFNYNISKCDNDKNHFDYVTNYNKPIKLDDEIENLIDQIQLLNEDLNSREDAFQNFANYSLPQISVSDEKLSQNIKLISESKNDYIYTDTNDKCLKTYIANILIKSINGKNSHQLIFEDNSKLPDEYISSLDVLAKKLGNNALKNAINLSEEEGNSDLINPYLDVNLCPKSPSVLKSLSKLNGNYQKNDLFKPKSILCSDHLSFSRLMDDKIPGEAYVVNSIDSNNPFLNEINNYDFKNLSNGVIKFPMKIGHVFQNDIDRYMFSDTNKENLDIFYDNLDNLNGEVYNEIEDEHIGTPKAPSKNEHLLKLKLSDSIDIFFDNSKKDLAIAPEINTLLNQERVNKYNPYNDSQTYPPSISEKDNLKETILRNQMSFLSSLNKFNDIKDSLQNDIGEKSYPYETPTQNLFYDHFDEMNGEVYAETMDKHLNGDKIKPFKDELLTEKVKLKSSILMNPKFSSSLDYYASFPASSYDKITHINNVSSEIKINFNCYNKLAENTAKSIIKNLNQFSSEKFDVSKTSPPAKNYKKDNTIASYKSLDNYSNPKYQVNDWIIYNDIPKQIPKIPIKRAFSESLSFLACPTITITPNSPIIDKTSEIIIEHFKNDKVIFQNVMLQQINSFNNNFSKSDIKSDDDSELNSSDNQDYTKTDDSNFETNSRLLDNKPDELNSTQSKPLTNLINESYQANSIEILRQDPLMKELTLEEDLYDHINYRLDSEIIEPYKRIFSHGGYFEDNKSTPIVCLYACYLPCRSTPNYEYIMEQLFFYIVKTLHILVEDDYIIIFFEGSAPKNLLPNFRWLLKYYRLLEQKQGYEVLLDQNVNFCRNYFKKNGKLPSRLLSSNDEDEVTCLQKKLSLSTLTHLRKLKKNIKSIYVVHPSLWFRTVCYMCRPFMVSKFWQKLNFVNSLKILKENIPTLDLNFLPDQLLSYDSKL
ncbi:uncharacterized protein LOC135931132 isoform X4 [Gordionus sp. m RMFG-2023]|uniref:uncharacterized protein LOC135931132 isoform X4 n=1 Tax=Gordionus sp. m RMFG-2023 TaxID=3053472 RepID=UPI0031FBF02E